MLTPDLAQALGYQGRILQQVSRTFALTIPCLPEALRHAVGNGYLLCRIADTIEDDPELSWEEKAHWQSVFVGVVAGRADAAAFARDFAGRLSPQMPAAEHDLIRHTPQVLALTHSFTASQQAALLRCVRIMGEGMAEFQRSASRAGLPDMATLDRYCYVVAGVVGEMLTSLFVEQVPGMAAYGAEMQRLAVSFGQGLQMTNILKDIWGDWARGVSWLPRAVFDRHGCQWEQLAPGTQDPGFHAGIRELVAVAGRHLDDALRYTLRIPREETGMRDFCLWAIAMAVLTLRRIAERPDFVSGDEVKISRRSVGNVVLLSRFIHRSDSLLKLSFRLGVKPLAALTNEPSL